jgi:hypothetical protein
MTTPAGISREPRFGPRWVKGLIRVHLYRKGVKVCDLWIASPSGGERGSPSRFSLKQHLVKEMLHHQKECTFFLKQFQDQGITLFFPHPYRIVVAVQMGLYKKNYFPATRSKKMFFPVAERGIA